MIGINIDINEGNETGVSDGEIIGTTLGAMYGISLGACVGTKLGSSEYFTDGTAYGKIEGLLLGD